MRLAAGLGGEAMSKDHGDDPPPVAGLSRRGCFGALLFGAATSLSLSGCVVPPAAVTPQTIPTTAGAPLSGPQIEQLLAPIALYPDALLAQVLMASTYPLEIVQAHRWRTGHGSLTGAALDQALQGQPWDVSVKSLVPFPDVLRLLNDHLDWTQQLGDTVLAQQTEVLAAIQALRGRAQASGTLRSTAEQTVAGTPGAITIEPAQPSVVYVPVYDPMYAYGAWPYSAYPPYYWPYGAGVVAAGIGFAAGIAIAGGYWGWARPGWGGGDINIDADRIRNIDRDRVQHHGNRWQHDSRHRQGVAYRDGAVRDRYQGNRGQGAASREQFRGRAQQQPAGASRGAGQGFSGLGSGRDTRAASTRGAASRQAPRGGFGGGYGGGGFRGGGGGFRGGGGRGGRR